MVFSYIASLLGFQGNNDQTTVDNESSTLHQRPSFSCEGYGVYPPPDPAIGLRVTTDDIVKVFGHPPQEDYPGHMRYFHPYVMTDNHFVHFLPGDCLAYVKYVMGDDWRSQLRTDYKPLPSEAVILGPSAIVYDTAGCGRASVHDMDSVAKAEERSHSLRMRRCGAVAVSCNFDTNRYDNFRQKAPLPRYLFGWPRKGGVWVSRPPWSIYPPTPTGDYYERYEEIMEDDRREIAAGEAYALLVDKVKQQDDVEDVCRVLEDSGAQF
jgi:hypothetical protein